MFRVHVRGHADQYESCCRCVASFTYAEADTLIESDHPLLIIASSGVLTVGRD